MCWQVTTQVVRQVVPSTGLWDAVAGTGATGNGDGRADIATFTMPVSAHRGPGWGLLRLPVDCSIWIPSAALPTIRTLACWSQVCPVFIERAAVHGRAHTRRLRYLGTHHSPNRAGPGLRHGLARLGRRLRLVLDYRVNNQLDSFLDVLLSGGGRPPGRLGAVLRHRCSAPLPSSCFRRVLIMSRRVYQYQWPPPRRPQV